MKKLIKRALKKLGLYEIASCGYQMLKEIRPSRVAKEFRIRVNGAPDGFPVPSARLIYRIIARGWAEQYLALGHEAASDIIAQLEACDVDIGEMGSILDFGCGCGRIIRHLRPAADAKLYGSDYNSDLIGWCSENLPFARFDVNRLEPPLEYDDGQFDLIYMISVFTHLSGSLQRRWAAELHRVLRSRGVLLFTTHGEQYLEFLDDEQREKLLSGEVVVIERDEEGTNHYGSFETHGFVRENLLQGFELLSFTPGKERLVQDTYVARKLG